MPLKENLTCTLRSLPEPQIYKKRLNHLRSKWQPTGDSCIWLFMTWGTRQLPYNNFFRSPSQPWRSRRRYWETSSVFTIWTVISLNLRMMLDLVVFKVKSLKKRENFHVFHSEISIVTTVVTSESQKLSFWANKKV